MQKIKQVDRQTPSIVVIFSHLTKQKETKIHHIIPVSVFLTALSKTAINKEVVFPNTHYKLAIYMAGALKVMGKLKSI